MIFSYLAHRVYFTFSDTNSIICTTLNYRLQNYFKLIDLLLIAVGLKFRCLVKDYLELSHFESILKQVFTFRSDQQLLMAHLSGCSSCMDGSLLP